MLLKATTELDFIQSTFDFQPENYSMYKQHN